MKITTRALAQPAAAAGSGTRSRWLAAAVASVALTLTGCSESEMTPDDFLSPQPSMGQPDDPEPTATEAGEPQPSPSSSTTAEPTSTGIWGAYSSQAEACTAVAADVVAVAFLPVSLGFGATQEAIDDAEAEIDRIKEDSPWVVTADFARLQLIVDEYSEAVAAEEEDASFDGEAFQEALDPIQEWLTENCEDPAGGEDDGEEDGSDEESSAEKTPTED